MNNVDLRPGIIVRGPMPEPVEVLVVAKLTSAGQKSGQVHQRVLREDQIALHVWFEVPNLADGEE